MAVIKLAGVIINVIVLNIHNYMLYIIHSNYILVGHVVAQWLRHCATNQKVTGSIPDGVNGMFH
jgi:hypothetical protein